MTVAASRHEVAVEADSDVRLDLYVARALALSRTQSATLIAQGNVLVSGRREKASYKPVAGDMIAVEVPPPPGREVLPESIPLTVVYEDDAVLVIDKPAGMVVHPAPGHWEGTLVNALLGRGGPLSTAGGAERAGLVHRLDKDTSGLLLVARTESAHRRLSAALAARQITRRYAALSWGHLAEDRVVVEKPVARHPRDRHRMTILPEGKPAKTTFDRLARFTDVDLLRAHLHTGRTHQIRVHLSSIGHPVAGDDVYGGGGGRRVVGLPPRRHFLHAAWLRFRHPEDERVIDLRSPLPPDLRRSLAIVADDPELEADPDPLARFGFFDLGSGE